MTRDVERVRSFVRSRAHRVVVVVVVGTRMKMARRPTDR